MRTLRDWSWGEHHQRHKKVRKNVGKHWKWASFTPKLQMEKERQLFVYMQNPAREMQPRKPWFRKRNIKNDMSI